ncbi:MULTISPECIES: serine/threonine protein kinase [Bifidobacterium]|uniref:Serine/threonine protein kinase n=2 Tax=Bifidobacterium TaxID=1678 RepID=A0A2M9HPF1_9BIFI|nr:MULTISPECIES: serine/threonine-protein kinase [Bifidobacterium]NMM98812.1 serine/threonine protein kinase [Bifidobacterium sp. DSM 109959]PJM78685.1 serine/threonine protein kinase [Bifidobacterium scaligerum]
MVGLNTVVGKRYKILTQIGKGGMSAVYLAMDSSLNKQWAVKEIRNVSDPVQRDLVIKSLTVEANMIKRFDHPAIPRIVDLIEEKGSLFVVMDYVEGQTLASLLKKEGPQSEDDVVDWGIQLCDVLDYLHRRKHPVIFRDMKPSNVMLTPEGSIKLIDFGIALETGKGADNKPLVGDDRQLGTPGFGAPEQFTEGATVDARTDIYALGATLFYLLTGSHPRKNGIVPIRQINPSLSQGLEAVIEKATRENPDERFQTCADFAYALKHYREEDEAWRSALKAKWHGFLGTSIAAVVCLALAGGCMLLANHAQNSDYDYWMAQGAQNTDDTAAEAAFVRAAEVKTTATQPYEELIKRYTADGDFTDAEEQIYNELISQHATDLRKDADSWASLSYDTGRMYWYYYSGSKMASQTASATNTDPQRYARIRAASQWMHNAAEDTNFKNAKIAKIYADIADFNTEIVPLINEGSDSGKYLPYFTKLNDLVTAAGQENNDVIRLEAANLTLDALRVYPRKFRADGVKQQAMSDLADAAATLADQAQTTTDELDASKKTAQEAVQPTKDAIANAFVDIKGDAK